MSEEADQNNQEDEASSRADPFFKLLTRLQAEQLGLQARETELQYSTRADLVLLVPPGLNLEGTLFDFFRATNVLEFKSQADKFNLREYSRNQLRTDLTFLQGNEKDYRQLLNVIVCSRQPCNFIKYVRENKIYFWRDKNKPWLRRAQVGFQAVVIVLCNELPLEERYYFWLIFAPAGSKKWKALIRTLLELGRQELLETVRRMRPEEYKVTVEEILNQLRAEGVITSKDEAQIEQVDADLAMNTLQDLLKRNSAKLGLVLSTLPAKERLSGLKPEERLSGLKPEERLAGLSEEERQSLLKKLLEEQGQQENN